MEIDQINKLINKLRTCTSQLESYQKGGKKVMSFQEIGLAIQGVTCFFKEKKIKKGDKIGIIGTNCVEWVIIDLACISEGIITVPFDPAVDYNINELLSEFDLPFILSNLESYKSHNKVFEFEDVCQRNCAGKKSAIVPVHYAQDDVLTYKFTSGSTQRPKVIGAMKQSVDAAITFVQQIFEHTREERILIFLPLHTYQQRYWIYSAILFDFTIILVPKEYIFFCLRTEKPTVVMGVPFFFETLMKNFLAEAEDHPEKNDNELKQMFHLQLGGQLRYLWTGSAPLGADTLAFFERMEMPLFQGYGMNEVCIVSKNYFDNNKPGSVGKLLPGKHVKFDENNQLLVKSEYPVNFSYFNATDEDNDATFLNDGYVATGDTGYMDEDGYLYINGRLKELIVLANAIKVHPSIVEKKIETSRLVKHCIVYGDEHPFLVALIVPVKANEDHLVLKEEIARINLSLKPHERVIKFFIAPEGFSQNGNRVSGQDKLHRKRIIEDYRAELENLYLN